jgi:XTP/dITP diphosphohydrolase
MNTIVLATNNQGKIAEFRQLFSLVNLTIIPQNELNVAEVDETGSTFAENALLKAQQATRQTGLPAVADDSGIIVDALNGAPGIYSARYASTERNMRHNYEKVLNEMVGIPINQRTARFHCCLVFLENINATPVICAANWEGYILEQAQGENGFGYDPIFYVPTHECSAAELPDSIKNEISHRAQAMHLLREKLAGLL